MWLVIVSALKSVKWGKVAPYIIVGILVAGCVARYYYLTVNLNAASMKIDALQSRNEVYAMELTTAMVTVRKLDAAIQNQNSRIIILKESGERMDKMQRHADRLALEVIEARSNLAVANDRVEGLKQQAAALPVCGVYEEVLIVIGGSNEME